MNIDHYWQKDSTGEVIKIRYVSDRVTQHYDSSQSCYRIIWAWKVDGVRRACRDHQRRAHAASI